MKASDFCEACQRALSGNDELILKELGIERQKWPPPTPEVAEIMRGIISGYKASRMYREAKAIVEANSKKR